MRDLNYKHYLRGAISLLFVTSSQSGLAQATLLSDELTSGSDEASLYQPMRESMRGNFSSDSTNAAAVAVARPNDSMEFKSVGQSMRDDAVSYAPGAISSRRPDEATANNDRQQRVEIDRYQQTDWTIGLRGDVDYSSNLFGAQDGEEQSGIYGEAAVILRYAYGDRENRQENFVAFTYEPGVSWFGEDVNGGDAHFDHRAAFEGRITRSRTFAQGDLKLDRVRETFAAIGTRVERLSTSGNAEIGYQITSKVDLALTGHFTDHQFDDEFVASSLGNLYDSSTLGGGIALIYHPDPKLQYRIHAYTGRVDVEDFPEGYLCDDGQGSPSQDYIGATFGGRYEISPYVTGEFTIGAENWDQDGNSDSTNPVGELALTYSPSERNQMRLGLGYGTRPSPYIVGANAQTLHLSFLGEKSVGHAVTLGLQADLRALDYDVYHNCEGAPDELSSESFFTVSPFVRYRFTDRLSAELSYTRAEKSSDHSFLEFSEDRVGLSASIGL